jgi:uncharacterized RDD family membrane protein YckC
VFVDRVSVITPERVLVEHEIAGVGSRAVAQTIDGLILSLGYVPMFIVIGAMAASALPAWLAVTLLIVLAAGWPFGYFILLEWRYGATLGKRAMRIRVLTEHGAPIGFRESMTRNLLRIVDLLPAGYALGGIVALVSNRSQRLGDMAAGTITVRIGKLPRAEARRASGSFVEMVAADREAAEVGLVSAELAAVIAQFLGRLKTLTPEARIGLAGRIARRAETELPRPAGMTDEQYLTYIHNREYL